ncbi:MAG: glutamate-5-semialdehyde dehydrogenase [Candidatus Hydrogenedentes bacterium]|nr:glutamate-5-semialdehyde dehydrogenase [Candidatus Hydrogenedentota bacterium]
MATLSQDEVSDLRSEIASIGRRARAASNVLRTLSSSLKDSALAGIARRLRDSHVELIAENEKDLDTGRKKNLSSAMLDRLALTPKRIDAMADGLEQVAALPDPVGDIVSQVVRPNGLKIAQIRVPLGVVGIIYESRPNVTADAAALCLKSGNACILRGGSEAIHSNLAIAKIFQEVATNAGVPDNAVQMISTTDRNAVGEMLKLDKYIDVIVPRGGKNLIERIYAESRIPVVAHLDGICITYVHSDADLAMAKRVCLNAKLQRPGTCNAMETMLVHSDVATAFLHEIGRELLTAGCEIRGCERTQRLIACTPAKPDDFETEFLDKILAVKVVDSLDEAIAHIGEHGSHHSDAIITASYDAAERFLNEVDSATVYVNASTRFTDGFEFGLGAEIGISTNKLHCRGPMALKELTSLKYIIRGSGQIRE